MKHGANLILDLVSLFTVLLVLYSEFRQTRHNANHPSRFRTLLTVLCLVLSMDMVGWLLDGMPAAWVYVPAVIVNTVYYMLQIVFSWLWLLFVLEWTGASISQMRRWQKLVSTLPLAAEVISLLSNLFTGWAFWIDPSNTYQRGPGHVLNLLPFAAYLCATLAVILHAAITARSDADKRHSLILCLYMFLPVCGALVEAYNYGTPWTWPLTSLSLLLVCMSELDSQASKERVNAARLEVELAESRRAIMLSQIQPHFLYNTLCVIQDLCHDKAPEAEKATLAFSRFLRGNMESLTTKGSIPFDQELAHTRYYLDLEQTRFGDRLHVVYHIQCRLFRLPPLTLQPIVENAVRNGICKREEGGTVPYPPGKQRRLMLYA